MTKRDRYILMVIAAVGLVAAYWFLALAPKRDRVGKLDKDLAEAKQTLAQSQQEKTQFAQAQVQFPALYASLGRLGKAVPASEDVPSLLVQLNHAADQANVDFRSIELKLDLVEKLNAEGGAAAAASAAAAAPATGATGATGASGAPSGTATASATTTAPAAGATPAGGATTGAATGALQPLPFQYKFNGDFYSLENLIHNVTRLVEHRNRALAIAGRLVAIEGFAMKRGKVTIVATTYMLPADQGLFGGATPAGPAGATGATPQPASASASGSTSTPPSAAVTTP
jgi:type II secretory pathway component PulM